MSYIHEALKKAQVEREVQSPSYEGLTAAQGKRPMHHWKRKVLWGLPLCLIILFAVLTFFRFNFEDQPKPVPKSNIEKSDIREQKTEKERNANIQELFLKAKTLQKNGLLKEAEQEYKKVVKVDPGYVPALNNLGVVYLHGQNFSDARLFFEKAIRLNPGYLDPYYNLACLFALTNDQEQALRYLRKAISMDTQAKQWAVNDADLINLRSLPAFQEMVE